MLSIEALRSDSSAMALPWLESPFTPALLARATHLTHAERTLATQYAQDGYAVLDLGLGSDFCEALIEGLQPHYRDDARPHSSAVRLQDAWEIPDAKLAAKVMSVACHPKILAALNMLYRKAPIPFQTLNFPVGTQQESHSDALHFHSRPQRYMCGVWTALEDVTIDCGPLHYYPGSQKLPVFTLEDMGLMAAAHPGAAHIKRRPSEVVYRDYEVFVRGLVEAYGLQKKVLMLKRGQALIWSANLLHGGEPILDPQKSRHSQVTHYFFEDCVYYTPLFSDMAVGAMGMRTPRDIRTGQKVDGRYLGHRLYTRGFYEPAKLSPPPKVELRLGKHEASKAYYLFRHRVRRAAQLGITRSAREAAARLRAKFSPTVQ